MARQRRRAGWLSSLLGDSADPPGTSYQLAVLQGADAGASWTIDRPNIQIGRRIPGTTGGGGIELNDRSVSARHALLSCEDGRVHLEHLPSATNPTLVNGRRIKRKRIRDGDRIALGLVVLELRARYPEAPAVAPHREPSPSRIETDPIDVQGELVLRAGAFELAGVRFPLTRRRTTIGRDDDCDIVIGLSSVSRNHAALVWEGDQLVLVHESAVNPTHVNGMPIHDRRRVFHGDEIRISERVAFEVVLQAGEVPAGRPGPATDAEATRLTTPPGAADSRSPGALADVEATRTSGPGGSQAPSAREAATDDDATRIEPAPHSDPPFPDADATRIAPAPDLPGHDDADRTVVRPAPGSRERGGESDRTRIVNLDPVLERDEARTLVRPSPLSDSERTVVRPRQPAPDDEDETVVRPRPDRRPTPAAETVVIESRDEPDDESD